MIAAVSLRERPCACKNAARETNPRLNDSGRSLTGIPPPP